MAQRSIDILINARDRSAAALARAGRGIRRLGASLTSLRGALITGAIGATVIQGIRNFASSLQDSASEVRKFENELTELLSLGDNIRNIDNIRQSVLGMSNAFGIARSQIADAMFNLQSGTANLSKVIQNELLRSSIELKEVYGGDLSTDMKALVKVFQIYGNTIQDVTSIQQKLAFLAEEGFLTFEEMATLLPDVASAAQAMGTSLDEVVAALVVATQRGGKTEKTFTGFRNVILRMNKAQEEGIALSGSLADRLSQLRAATEGRPELIKKIFGDEAIATANNLLTSVSQIDDVLRRLDTDVPDVGAKLASRFTDAAFQAAKLNEQFENLIANAKTELTLPTLRRVTQFDAAETAFKLQQQRDPFKRLFGEGFIQKFLILFNEADLAAQGFAEAAASVAVQAKESGSEADISRFETALSRFRELADDPEEKRILARLEAILSDLQGSVAVRQQQQREQEREGERQRVEPFVDLIQKQLDVSSDIAQQVADEIVRAGGGISDIDLDKISQSIQADIDAESISKIIEDTFGIAAENQGVAIADAVRAGSQRLGAFRNAIDEGIRNLGESIKASIDEQAEINLELLRQQAQGSLDDPERGILGLLELSGSDEARAELERRNIQDRFRQVIEQLDEVAKAALFDPSVVSSVAERKRIAEDALTRALDVVGETGVNERDRRLIPTGPIGLESRLLTRAPGLDFDQNIASNTKVSADTLPPILSTLEDMLDGIEEINEKTTSQRVVTID